MRNRGQATYRDTTVETPLGNLVAGMKWFLVSGFMKGVGPTY